MKVLVLAGGSGTRLWPLSRQFFPKQFLKLRDEKSLLRLTVERFGNLAGPEDHLILTGRDYKFLVRSELEDCPHVLLEPCGRNTAPAIAFGMKYCMEKLGCNKDEVVFVTPSDQSIGPVEEFQKSVRTAIEAAREGNIVTFGIKPTRPETGYGYLKCGKAAKGAKTPVVKVERFVEKPDSQTAQAYLEEGNYLWNSGMFCFTLGTMLSELIRYFPEIVPFFEGSFAEFTADFEKIPSISIDFSVMEKSEKVVSLPLSLFWNDIGSWDSLFKDQKTDERGNHCEGNVVSIESEKTLILGGKRLIAAVGLEDCLIVDTEDAILVSKRGKTQLVKQVVEELKARKAREAVEHLTIFRPWGSYTILEEGPRYKIKRIVVDPQCKLSLQMHHHRSEHWVVVRGTAKVSVGEKTIFIHENESAYVPMSTSHRLENPGKVPLEVIEVQNGEYLGEDDIIRMDDVYGREE